MSHKPTLERVSIALEPLFPIELRFSNQCVPGSLNPASGLYHLFVISRKFEGLPKIERHRLVFEYLKPFIGHGIHNINMTLLAPSESRH
ncbi:MAG: BolA family transcriptional regulator [Burkholderiales bacterium]|nr:BolA family transcriptional regulator [Burkholderiales bacterium]